MAYTSDTPPLCRCCGKPIPKRTSMVYFASGVTASDLREVFPVSRAEAQRYTNGQIVSVRWNRYNPSFGAFVVGHPAHDYISMMSVWDGVSYEDEFFHNQNCARVFALVMARAGNCTHAYLDAVEAALAKKAQS